MINNNKNIGKIVIISGPSGVGKGTICKFLLESKDLQLELSTSCTTRTKRNNEEQNKNYFFLTKNEFENKIINNEFLEYVKFINNYYGTLRSECQKILNNGKNVLLEIETDGALKIMKKEKNIISIFLLPPNLNELEKRIINRNTENKETIKKRINKAKEEILLKNKYDYSVINDNLNKTIISIKKILIKELKINNDK